MSDSKQEGVSVMPNPQSMQAEDEINLFELWQALKRQKILIFSSTIIFLLAGIFYAFVIAVPVYKAEAFLLQPLAKDVQGLNVQGLNVQGYNSKKVYEIVMRNLNSRSMRRKYFNEHKLVEQLVPGSSMDVNVDEVFEGFNNNLKVSQGKNAFATVSFEGPDARLASEWVNGFIALAEWQIVADLVSDIMYRIKLTKQSIQENISGKRKLAQQRRLDQVSRLEEALLIARELGVEENKLLAVSSANQSAVTVSTEKPPPYMKGVKALQAEIRSLQGRKSDDPFIAELRDLQEHLARLDNIRVDKSAIHVVRLDQAALPPEHHIKPKRKLIVLLALFGGLLFGIFAAFIAEFIRNLRREETAL